MLAVNPNADEVEGDSCHHDLKSIPGFVEAVVIGTRPETTARSVESSPLMAALTASSRFDASTAACSSVSAYSVNDIAPLQAVSSRPKRMAVPTGRTVPCCTNAPGEGSAQPFRIWSIAVLSGASTPASRSSRVVATAMSGMTP
ncbi:MAG: CoA-binding protein [Acidimicrobiia bacterium]|nr:CoA-binding protein [Acidimicrobiia bacterium]